MEKKPSKCSSLSPTKKMRHQAHYAKDATLADGIFLCILIGGLMGCVVLVKSRLAFLLGMSGTADRHKAITPDENTHAV